MVTQSLPLLPLTCLPSSCLFTPCLKSSEPVNARHSAGFPYPLNRYIVEAETGRVVVVSTGFCTGVTLPYGTLRLRYVT